MNKQEIVEKIKVMTVETFFSETLFVNQKEVIKLIEQLDEPQKPVVSQMVADWIEKVGNKLFGLNYDSVPSEIYDWVYGEEGNLKKLHLACAIGYEIEKETKYTVKVKATKQYLCNDELGPHFSPNFRSNFTKTNLEELGFGWVFDCEGIEVEEV